PPGLRARRAHRPGAPHLDLRTRHPRRAVRPLPPSTGSSPLPGHRSRPPALHVEPGREPLRRTGVRRRQPGGGRTRMSTVSRAPADQQRPTTPSSPPLQLRWWREVMIAGGFYLAYSIVRNTFGAGPESRSIAFRHARGVIEVERWLGLWF